jgi:glycosyltransferase involved in cell wall biosynthesis
MPVSTVVDSPLSDHAAAALPRILLLTYISPLQKWGSAQRTRFLIEALSRHGQVEVLVLALGSDPANHGHISEDHVGTTPVRELQIRTTDPASRPRFDITSDFVSREVASRVDLSRYDLIVSRYIKPALKLKTPPNVPLIVDFDDALYEPPWGALTSLKMWVGVFLRLLNDRVIVRSRLRLHPRRYAHFFFCREAEREVFPWLPGSVLPNLPAAPARPGPPDFSVPRQPALMFIGLLDYMPNKDAVNWFLEKIWPLVLQEVPKARFLLVGSGEADTLRAWAAHPGVEALGFVDSLADTYAQVTAAVVPMRSGAGTNIKALEPYLYGRAVIATPLVLEGHRPLFRDGQDMLTADDAEGMARHCIDVLNNPKLARDVAQNGHARITAHLTKARFQAVVDEAVSSALGKEEHRMQPNQERSYQ